MHHCGIPKVDNGIDYLELNAIGIKLNDIDSFLSALAPRIAGKLLIEQRHFFMQVVQKNCKNGHCPSEWLVEDNSHVKKGDLIAVLETTKATVDIEAEEDGKIKIIGPSGISYEFGSSFSISYYSFSQIQ